MINIELKKIEEGFLNIYENKNKKRLIDARELHQALGNKRKFSDWIKQRIDRYGFIENYDYNRFHNFVKGDLKGYGNKTIIEYYVTIDMAKELCMVENNEMGRKIRRYFIEVESRYKEIIYHSSTHFEILKEEISEIKNAEKENHEEIKKIKGMLDIKIFPNYCLASDIASHLELYSENHIPHIKLISAIAKELGMKIGYKHYYEDETIVIVKDISNKGYQVYYKPLGVEKINKWFLSHKDELYYEIMYLKNTKNKRVGEVRERGYRIDNICYKIE